LGTIGEDGGSIRLVVVQKVEGGRDNVAIVLHRHALERVEDGLDGVV